MPIEFNQLTSTQIGQLSRSETVFFFSVGVLEDHGPHLPIGLDLAEAKQLSWLMAKKLESEKPGWVGVLIPGFALGIETNTSQVTLKVRAHVLRDALVDSCRSLIRMGFAHFVCFSGSIGPKQLTTIEEAGKLIRKFGLWRSPFGSAKSGSPIPTLISANSGLISARDVLRSPLWPDPTEHGGKRDTSVALALNGSLVNASYKNLVTVNPVQPTFRRLMNRITGRIEGYWGSPADAQTESGEMELEDKIAQLFPMMKAIWDGAPPASLFRSWYSVIPFNQSFFKIWVILILILFFLCGWVYLSIMAFPVIQK